jgi:hypothetical protein
MVDGGSERGSAQLLRKFPHKILTRSSWLTDGQKLQLSLALFQLLR